VNWARCRFGLDWDLPQLHVCMYPPDPPFGSLPVDLDRHSVVQASSSDWVAGRAVTADHIQRTTRRPAGGTTDELAAGGHRAQQPQSRPGADKGQKRFKKWHRQSF